MIIKINNYYNAYKQGNSATADYFKQKNQCYNYIILALVASITPGNVLLRIVISLLDQLLSDLVVGFAKSLHQRIVLCP